MQFLINTSAYHGSVPGRHSCAANLRRFCRLNFSTPHPRLLRQKHVTLPAKCLKWCLYVKKLQFLVDISIVLRFNSEMTPKEFEHKVMEMRSQALSAALGFGFQMEEAEDVAQDVMLRLWAIHERIGAEDPVGVLARMATRNACIDKLRLMKQEEDFEQSEAGINRVTPSDELEYKELKEWLTRQIELLPPTLGIVLRMRQIERRSVQEISTLLGIGERSVSTLLSRARHQLKEELEKRNNNT